MDINWLTKKDKNGYLESLGKPRIAQVKRDADIATADAEKETRIKRAELERATEIAEAEKINKLKVAEFRREQDIAKARADRTYNHFALESFN